MRLASFGLLALLAWSAGDGPKSVVPNQPDLAIRVRRTFGGAGGASELHALWFKGARSRQERWFQSGQAAPQSSGGAWIGQCDAQRLLVLNAVAKTYGFIPLSRMLARPTTAVLEGALIEKVPPIDEASRPELVMTIDAVDTGERRQMAAGLTARHVVTTTRTGPGGEYPDVETRVEDGWYVDLPPADCVDWGANGTAIATLSIAGPNRPRVRVTQLHTARRGFPLIETDRSITDQRTFTGRTELVEISDRAIDPALFDVPPDYRPALPRWDGDFDITRPDTLTNRVRLFWESAAGWFHRIWW